VVSSRFGIDLTELRGSDVEMFEILPRKFKTDFHSKMSVCRHELGVKLPQPPRQFQPWSPPVIQRGAAKIFLASKTSTYYVDADYPARPEVQ